MSYSYILPDDFFYDLQNYTFETNGTYYFDPDKSPCEPKELDPAVAVALCLIFIVIFLLAVPGNLLVLWVIGTNKQALIPSDVYLFHLTVADGLVALTLPFCAVAAVQGWIFGDFMCKLLSLIIDANFYTSIIFLACISIDRYVAIVHANETQSSHQSHVLCAAVWAAGSALGLPALFKDATKFSEDSDLMICYEVFDSERGGSWRLATRMLGHILGFLFPLGVMLFCYSIAIMRLLRAQSFRKHRAMKVIIAVVIAFLLCWIPYHVTLIIDTVLRAKLVQFDCAMRMSVNLALTATNFVALLHSCINPVLYAFVGERFRKKMMLLCLKRVRQKRAPSIRVSRSTSQTSEGNGALL
ncbi:C-X-C chemokine receptor type 1-like [Solea solea]|uniref:C-X-C chemokine receptor type 1-like n=1 Tax=Solea solea TaxID=90069 RepID=UPI00272D0E52|nr:C-X-C chemokine receptor type 1-like [Solea solea]